MTNLGRLARLTGRPGNFLNLVSEMSDRHRAVSHGGSLNILAVILVLRIRSGSKASLYQGLSAVLFKVIPVSVLCPLVELQLIVSNMKALLALL